MNILERVKNSYRLRLFQKWLRIYLNPYYLIVIWRYHSRMPRNSHFKGDRGIAIQEGIEWLIRSQKNGGDDGSSCYRLTDGWSKGYPEVTGYNLFTLLEYHDKTKDQMVYETAIKMADWLLEVQLPSGAYQSGYVDSKPIPIVFNTGQVAQGLLRAYTVTGEEKYLNGACKAAEWLIGTQDPDGAWRRNVYLNVFRVTDTRVAYPLLEIWKTTNHDRYKNAAVKCLKYVIKKQTENGWFSECDNSIEFVDQPNTHTIGYTVEGLLKSGLILEKEEYIDAAKLTADFMLRKFELDGLLFGRYDNRWRPTVTWSCLTGCAQFSEIWSILAIFMKDPWYLNSALKINDYLIACQDIKTRHPGIRGGISGSEPIGGKYQSYSYPSWATKYFCDALARENEAKGIFAN